MHPLTGRDIRSMIQRGSISARLQVTEAGTWRNVSRAAARIARVSGLLSSHLYAAV